MTEQIKEHRTYIVRDREGTAESLARPLTDVERGHGLPCFVYHPDAGGSCEREATTMVYGILFCEEHGAEASMGALLELYQDAGDFLERLDNPHVQTPNEEALRALRRVMRRMDAAGREQEAGEEEALTRAYPTITERVCSVTREYDPNSADRQNPGRSPCEVQLDARRLLHKLMRQAYEEGADWLVEILEYEREAVSTQAAFALEDYRRKTGRSLLG